MQTHTDERYRLRDTHKLGGTIWGEDLTEAEALKLKEEVAGSGKSRSLKVEPMDTPLVDPSEHAAAPAHTRARRRRSH